MRLFVDNENLSATRHMAVRIEPGTPLQRVDHVKQVHYISEIKAEGMLPIAQNLARSQQNSPYHA